MLCLSTLIIAKTLFSPDNETVQLLNEIEDEYQASIDFIRFIDDIDSGDLYKEETWDSVSGVRSDIIRR